MAAQEHFQIRSPVFNFGGNIPVEYTGEGKSVSPPLKWGSPPEGTMELVLICEDPDAPTSEPYVHWIVYGLSPNMSELPAGIGDKSPETIEFPFRQGQNSRGEVGYTGPRPPSGSGTHHYYFKLYALDTHLQLPWGKTKSEVLNAMEGHILSETEYMGIRISH
jgi:Raf kinase inhibitor-like YbhB/YbcL family protein